MSKKKPLEKKKKDTAVKVNTDVLKLVTDLNKKFGNNALRTGQQIVDEDYDEEGNIPRITTGNVSLDIDLGGGIPIGRFTQFSGGFSTTKSTQCWHVVATALNMGLVCAVFDAEGTNTNKYGDPDFEYLENFGITKEHYDSGQLIMIRPDSLEECTEICLKLQRSGHVHLALIDSIAVLEPMKVLDSAMDETVQMGLKQKLLGEFFSKYQLANNRLVREGKDGFTLICINQLREKIGCFQYQSNVLLADGTTEKIGKIVSNKMPVEVLSYNRVTGELEAKKVTNWFNNGINEEEFYNIIVDKPQGNGRDYVKCTGNHPILTPIGYVEADQLKVGDKVIQTLDNVLILDDVRKEILTGSMLGEGCIRREKQHSYNFRLSHCKEQEEYAKFKTEFFEGTSYIRESDNAYLFDSKKSQAFESYYRDWYVEDKKCIVPKGIKLTPLTLAIWFLDDGSFDNQSKQSIEIYTNRFTLESVKYLICELKEQHGLECKYREKNPNQYVITFDRNATKQFMEIIREYIHPSMFDKMEDFDCNSLGLCNLYSPIQYGRVLREATIQDITRRPKCSQMCKYDLEVEDNHNYIVDNVLVHNSYGDPEYEPGGRALGFTLSVNIRLRQGDLIKDNETKEIVGQVVKYKISKNKTGMRMISGEFDCYLDENTVGVPKFHSDNVKSIIIEGVNYEFIQKGGAWYYLNKGTKDELKFQGLDKLVDYIRENPHWIDIIKEKVMTAINSEDIIENGEEN